MANKPKTQESHEPKALVIHGVIKSVCDCDKWHDRMEESNNNCSTCDRPIM